MFCTDVGDEASVGHVVEGKERGRCADDKKVLCGEENSACRAVFGNVSEGEAQS